MSKQAAINELWRRGDLEYKAHAAQRQMRKTFYTSDKRILVWLCSRRLGKSTQLCSLGLEHMILRPRGRVVYAAPSREEAYDIVEPIIRDLIYDAPTDLGITEIKNRHKFINKRNGCELHIDGVDFKDGNALRGAYATLELCDEVGFWRKVKAIMNGVLMPMTLTCGGRVVMASSSPESVDHEFWSYVDRARFDGSLSEFTVYDNPLLTPELIEEYADECGGLNSTEFRREYLCQRVSEDTRLVVPEFRDAVHVAEFTNPLVDAPLEVIDFGVDDFTQVLFCYWSTALQKLYVVDEIVETNCSTPELAALIREKRIELWGSVQPKITIADNDKQQLLDLGTEGIHAAAAIKHQKKLAIRTYLRPLFRKDSILIHPRCKTLAAQLRGGLWNERRTDFERSETLGHLDGVDCLLYLSRWLDPLKTQPAALPASFERILPIGAEKIPSVYKVAGSGMIGRFGQPRRSH